MNRFLEFCEKHKIVIGMGLGGLVAAILMLTIGFFATLLIIVLTGIGLGYGYLAERFGFLGAWKTIVAFIKHIVSK